MLTNILKNIEMYSKNHLYHTEMNTITKNFCFDCTDTLGYIYYVILDRKNYM